MDISKWNFYLLKMYIDFALNFTCFFEKLKHNPEIHPSHHFWGHILMNKKSLGSPKLHNANSFYDTWRIVFHKTGRYYELMPSNTVKTYFHVGWCKRNVEKKTLQSGKSWILLDFNSCIRQSCRDLTTDSLLVTNIAATFWRTSTVEMCGPWELQM